MALLVDRCRPRSFDTIQLHRDVCDNLKRLVSNGNFPHIVFYGPSGAGKHTLTSALLREVYGPGAEKQKVEFRSFKTGASGSTTVDIRIVSSVYHVELAPSEVGNKDTVVIQQMIKELAQSPPIGNYPFKTVVISDADCLSKQAQAGLRRTMEKYSAFCRVILIAESLSRLIPPIRSRCLPVRVRSPTVQEISGVLSQSVADENVRISPEGVPEISNNCDRDLRKGYLLVDCARNVGSASKFDLKRTMAGSWEEGIETIVSGMIAEQTPRKLLDIRSKLYDLLSVCIPADAILRKMLDELIKRGIPEKIQSDVIAAASNCSHLLRLGTKDEFHLEYFCVQFMSLYRSKCVV